MAEEFKYHTPEEIAALPVFPEPESGADGGIRADGDRASPATPGYVYFIIESGGAFFKVGRTGHPKNRLVNLQMGNPRWLRMRMERVSDMVAVEARLL
jgi:hypothetical protein